MLTESVAMVLYLAEKYSAKGFMPNDLAQRAQLYKWLMFAATELEQPLWRIARHANLYPEGMRLPADVALARGDLAPIAEVLEQHMKERQFVPGSKVSVADFVLAYILDWANEIEILDEFEHLASVL